MQNDSRTQFWLRVFGVAGLLLFSSPLVRSQAAPNASLIEPGLDLKSLAATVHDLQSQVQSLTSQMNELRAAEQSGERHARICREHAVEGPLRKDFGFPIAVAPEAVHAHR